MEDLTREFQFGCNDDVMTVIFLNESCKSQVPDPHPQSLFQLCISQAILDAMRHLP